MDQSLSPRSGKPEAKRVAQEGQAVLQQIGWMGIFGVAATLILVVTFTWLTEEVFDKEFTQLDNGFELWVHGFASPPLNTFFNIVTTIGSIGGICVLTVLTFGLLWRLGHLRLAWLVALAVGGGILINQALKFLFQRPRPELWPVSGPRLATFSFPSGHSTASLCYFGALAWVGFRLFHKPLTRWAFAALMTFLILLVGLSRIYLGAHYPTDVLAAYLSGGVWLLILLNGSYIWRRLRRKAAEITS